MVIAYVPTHQAYEGAVKPEKKLQLHCKMQCSSILFCFIDYSAPQTYVF